MKVIILRGISGSGKSWLAKKLSYAYNDKFRDKEDYPEAVILSADKYFMKGGEYNFDARLLPKAHGWCLLLFMQALRAQPSELCIIDNINTRALEVAPYYAIAQAYVGSIVKLVTVMCPPDAALLSNRHSTPADVIWRQHQHILHEDLPPWWDHTVCFHVSNSLMNGLTLDPVEFLESME